MSGTTDKNKLPEQAEGVVRYPMSKGLPFDFLPNEGTITEGSVKLADGTAIKAGTYKTAEGLSVIVAADGTASLKEQPATETAEQKEAKKAAIAKKAEIKAIAAEHKVKELYENTKGEYFTSKHLALNSEGNVKANVTTHTID